MVQLVTDTINKQRKSSTENNSKKSGLTRIYEFL